MGSIYVLKMVNDEISCIIKSQLRSGFDDSRNEFEFNIN